MENENMQDAEVQTEQPQEMMLQDLIQQTINQMSMTPAMRQFNLEKDQHKEEEHIARAAAADVFDQGYQHGIEDMMRIIAQVNVRLVVTRSDEEATQDD